MNDTLVDGELVIDVEGTVKTPRFLMYDLVCLHGNDLLPTAGAENRNAPFQNYLHRLHVLEVRCIHESQVCVRACHLRMYLCVGYDILLQMELVMPRRQAEYYKAQYRHDFAAEPFRVRVKTFGELYQAGHVRFGHSTGLWSWADVNPYPPSRSIERTTQYAKLKTGHETDGLIFAPLYHVRLRLEHYRWSDPVQTDRGRDVL